MKKILRVKENPRFLQEAPLNRIARLVKKKPKAHSILEWAFY